MSYTTESDRDVRRLAKAVEPETWKIDGSTVTLKYGTKKEVVEGEATLAWEGSALVMRGTFNLPDGTAVRLSYSTNYLEAH